MAKRLLGKNEMEDIMWGSALLAAGGGGSAHDALDLLIRKIEKRVTLFDPLDLPGENNAVVVGGVGAPLALREKGFGPEVILAYEAMKNVKAVDKINLDYLLPAETGPLNIAAAFYVASQKNVPVIDADGCGRAAPELSTSLYSIYKIPGSPLVITNKAGDTIVVNLADPLNAIMAETIARTASSAFGMVAGFASWVVNITTINSNLVTNSISMSEKIGKAIRKSKINGDDPVKEVISITGGKEFFRGKIQKIEIITTEGHDFGRTSIKGIANYKSKTFVVDIKNENIIARQDGEPILMVPDLIAMMSISGEPLTNADTKEGMEVVIIGIKAPEPWTRTPEGFHCFKHILARMGYKGSYISPFTLPDKITR